MRYFGWALVRRRVWTRIDGVLVPLPPLWMRVGTSHADRAAAIAWAQRFRIGSRGGVLRVRILTTGRSR